MSRMTMDKAFFSQLLQMSDELFSKAVVHASIRKDQAAIAGALACMEKGKWQAHLWEEPKDERIQMRLSDGDFYTGKTHCVSLLHMAASACVAPLKEWDNLTCESIDAFNTKQRSGWVYYHQANIPAWNAQAQALVYQMIDLCEDQAGTHGQLMRDRRSPSALLLEAIADRTPYDEAIQLVVQGCQPKHLWEDSGVFKTLRDLFKNGQIGPLTHMINSCPQEYTPKLESLIVDLTSHQRHNSLFYKQALHPSRLTFAQAGAHVLAFTQALGAKVPQWCVDIPLAMIYALLNTQPVGHCNTLITDLIKQVDRQMGVTSEQSWPLDEQGNIKGSTAPTMTRDIVVSALKYHAAPVVEKLRCYLALDSKNDEISTAWGGINSNQSVDLIGFKKVMQCLRDSGVDISVFSTFPVGGWGNDIRVISNPMHCIAASGNDQAPEMMLILLELGADPHLRDKRKWEAASHLSHEPRSRWKNMLRSHLAREAANKAVEEITRELHFDGENVSLPQSTSPRPC